MFLYGSENGTLTMRAQKVQKCKFWPRFANFGVDWKRSAKLFQSLTITGTVWPLLANFGVVEIKGPKHWPALSEFVHIWPTLSMIEQLGRPPWHSTHWCLCRWLHQRDGLALPSDPNYLSVMLVCTHSFTWASSTVSQSCIVLISIILYQLLVILITRNINKFVPTFMFKHNNFLGSLYCTTNSELINWGRITF